MRSLDNERGRHSVQQKRPDEFEVLLNDSIFRNGDAWLEPACALSTDCDCYPVYPWNNDARR